MSSAYDNVVGGGLRLKGAGIKKKKKRKEGESSDAVVPADPDASHAPPPPPPPSFSTGRTDTEQRRLDTMERRKAEAAEKGEAKSHRTRVGDFNKYLSSLTEHYDLPKVSKGN